MKGKPIINLYKRLIFYSLLHEQIIKNPEKYYNFCFEILHILGSNEIRQQNIEFKQAKEIINYTIEFMENNFILANETIKILCY